MIAIFIEEAYYVLYVHKFFCVCAFSRKMLFIFLCVCALCCAPIPPILYVYNFFFIIHI
jgi:hypothetical protein